MPKSNCCHENERSSTQCGRLHLPTTDSGWFWAFLFFCPILAVYIAFEEDEEE